MSSLTSVVSLVGVGAISGWVYTIREYYMPVRENNRKYKERILVLEEEIVRLKREMRICGIQIPEATLFSSSSPPSSPPSSSPPPSSPPSSPSL